MKKISGGRFIGQMFGIGFVQAAVGTAFPETIFLLLIVGMIAFAMTMFSRAKAFKNGKGFAISYIVVSLAMVAIPALAIPGIIYNLIVILVFTFKNSNANTAF